MSAMSWHSLKCWYCSGGECEICVQNADKSTGRPAALNEGWELSVRRILRWEELWLPWWEGLWDIPGKCIQERGKVFTCEAVTTQWHRLFKVILRKLKQYLGTRLKYVVECVKWRADFRINLWRRVDVSCEPYLHTNYIYILRTVLYWIRCWNPLFGLDHWLPARPYQWPTTSLMLRWLNRSKSVQPDPKILWKGFPEEWRLLCWHVHTSSGLTHSRITCRFARLSKTHHQLKEYCEYLLGYLHHTTTKCLLLKAKQW